MEGQKRINRSHGLEWEEIGEVDDIKIDGAVSKKLEQIKYEETDQAMFDNDAAREK